MNKKQKTGPQLMEIPAEYQECEPEILIQMVVDMINRIIQHNDKVASTNQAVTRFHSRGATPITIHDYVQRIYKYVIVEKSVLIMLIVFIDRVTKIYPNFMLSSLTAHRYSIFYDRFIIAAVTASCKFISDVYSTNTFFAKVGGVSATELNILEVEFCNVMQWRINCSQKTLQQYYRNMAFTNQYVRLPDGTIHIPNLLVDEYLD